MHLFVKTYLYSRKKPAHIPEAWPMEVIESESDQSPGPEWMRMSYAEYHKYRKDNWVETKNEKYLTGEKRGVILITKKKAAATGSGLVALGALAVYLLHIWR